MRLIFLLYFLAAFQIFGQEVIRGEEPTYTNFPRHDVIAANDQFVTVLRLKKRATTDDLFKLAAPSITESDRIKSPNVYREDFTIIRYNSTSKIAEEKSFKIAEDYAIVNYFETDNQLIILGHDSKKGINSYSIDIVNIGTWEHVQKSKEVLRIEKKGCEFIHFEKKGLYGYELLLKIDNKNTTPTFYRFILDETFKVIHNDKIKLDPNFYNSTITVTNITEDTTALILTNRKSEQGILKIYPESNEFSQINSNQTSYFYSGKQLKSNPHKSILLTVSKKKNQLKNICYFDTKTLDYNEINIPPYYLAHLDSFQTTKGYRKYEINMLDDNTVSINPYNTIIRHYTDGSVSVSDYYGAILIMKVDEKENLLWSQILGRKKKKANKLIEVNSIVHSYQNDDYFFILYTNKKRKLVLNKIDKQNGSVTSLNAENLEIYNANFIHNYQHKSILYKDWAFFYIAGIPKDSQQKLSVSVGYPIWIKI